MKAASKFQIGDKVTVIPMDCFVGGCTGTVVAEVTRGQYAVKFEYLAKPITCHGRFLEAAVQHVAAFALMFALFLGIAWMAGFPDWSDPFEYDHPENFARHIIGE